ncbi:33156_t:CDS:2, partial [Gigaspora margarita]
MNSSDDDANSESNMYYETQEDNLATNNNEALITFHVHMPENLDKSMQPLVVGNVKELGKWYKLVVKLHKIDDNSTYWISDPVKIYLREAELLYKYAVYRPQKPQRWYDKVSNMASTLVPNLDNNFRFVNVIYESVTLENFKEKVMEFQMLLKHHNEMTVRAINIISIYNYLSNASNNYQKILACVMLSYHIENFQKKTHTHIKLRKNFPLANLLQLLQEVQADKLLPTNAKRSFTILTSALNKNEIQHFYNLLQKNVKPYVDKINKVPNSLIFQNVIKTIITISFFGIESCDFIINQFTGKENINREISDFLRDDYISKHVISDNPYELKQHYKSLTKELCD